MYNGKKCRDLLVRARNRGWCNIKILNYLEDFKALLDNVGIHFWFDRYLNIVNILLLISSLMHVLTIALPLYAFLTVFSHFFRFDRAAKSRSLPNLALGTSLQKKQSKASQTSRTDEFSVVI